MLGDDVRQLAACSPQPDAFGSRLLRSSKFLPGWPLMARNHFDQVPGSLTAGGFDADDPSVFREVNTLKLRRHKRVGRKALNAVSERACDKDCSVRADPFAGRQEGDTKALVSAQKRLRATLLRLAVRLRFRPNGKVY